MREYLRWRSRRPHPSNYESHGYWRIAFGEWMDKRPPDADQTLFIWEVAVGGAFVLSWAWWIGLNGGLQW